MIWSPVFRCVMMTWFATMIWTLTYFHGAYQNFKMEDLENPQVMGKRNQRILIGLDSKYPTQPKIESIDISSALLKMVILLSLPIFTFMLLRKHHNCLEEKEFKTKYSTLYTDLWTHKNSAAKQLVYFCFRRFLVAITTVFINYSIVPCLYVYVFSSLALVS